MSVVTSQQAEEHRVEVATQLMAEFCKAGFPCHLTRAMGAFWIDFNGHKGFCLEVEREWVRSDRPVPYEHDYTGRVVIEYQGFGRAGGTKIVEPEGGFDFPSLVAMLAAEIGESSQRRDAWKARKAEAEQTVADLVSGLESEYLNEDWRPGISGQVLQVQINEWRSRLRIEFDGLTESQARQLLDLAKSFQEVTS